MHGSLRKILGVILGLPLTIVSFYFIFSLFYTHRNSLSPEFIRPFPLGSGIIFLSAFFLLRGVTWNLILERFGKRVDTLSSIYVLSLSETKRYIPGNIFSFVARVRSFKKQNVDSKTVIAAIVIDSAILVFSSFVVSIPGIFLIGKNLGITVSLIFLGGVLLACGLAIFRRTLFLKSFRFLKKYKTAFFCSSIAWIVFGIGHFLIASSISNPSPHEFLPLVSFFVLTWLVGYLSFISPMGLGVREAVITFGLTPLLSTPVALSIAVFSRACFMASEVLFLLFVYCGYIFRKEIRRSIFRLSPQLSIVLALSVLYIVYFTFVTFEKHAQFFTGRFDLGNMDQTVWNTRHGRPFLLTNPDGTEIISRLAVHADFILMLAAPFYFFWEDPRMLLFIQTAIIGAGAFFIYRTAETVLGNKNLAVVFSFSYLLNPFIQKQNLYDFHAVTLATTFLLAAFYFLIKKKLLFHIFFLTLAVLCKENIYLVAAIFGGYLFLLGKKLLGSAVVVLSVGVFYLLLIHFIPNARGGDHFALSYFKDFGDSPGTIAASILSNPVQAIVTFFSLENINYYRMLLLPLGFLTLASPFYLIFSLGDIVINVFSNNKNFISLNFHYSATIIPFVYIAGVYGVKRLIQVFPKISQNLLAAFLIFMSLWTTWLYGALPGSRTPVLEVYENRVQNRKFIATYLATIPEHARVTATNNLGAHLAHREYIYTLPFGLEKAEYVVFLLNDIYAAPSLAEQKEMVKKLKIDDRYELLVEDGEFVAFKKIKKQKPNTK